MQPIYTLSELYHTIIINFILALPLTLDSFDNVILITDKFNKTVTLIAGQST